MSRLSYRVGAATVLFLESVLGRACRGQWMMVDLEPRLSGVSGGEKQKAKIGQHLTRNAEWWKIPSAVY